jgi:hypothetical protein
MKPFAMTLTSLLFALALGLSEIFGAAAIYGTRTDSGGGVTVRVTLLGFKTSEDLRFHVALDTHSVNLDSYDLKAISVLRDDAGNTYLPTAVENKGSGHHRETTVRFAKIANNSKRVELIIKDIAGVKERVFRWDLE